MSLKTNVPEHTSSFHLYCKVNSIYILGFTFDSTFAWQNHIVKELTHGKQLFSQLHQCCNNWIWLCLVIWHSIIPFVSSWWLTNKHWTYGSSKFASIWNCRNAAIMGLVCCLLSSKVWGNLLTNFSPLPQEDHTELPCWITIQNFRTLVTRSLDRFIFRSRLQL